MKQLVNVKRHNLIILRERISSLIQQYGGVRKASRAIQIDSAYLVRLRDGQKTDPSDKTLKRLGLKKHIHYSRDGLSDS